MRNATKQKPKAPAHLRPETQQWWATVVSGYVLDEHHLKLLQLACESFDRATAAREAIDAEGMFTTNRYGQKIAHPAIAIERDSKTGFARLLRELGLDLEEAPDTPRPPALPKWGRAECR